MASKLIDQIENITADIFNYYLTSISVLMKNYSTNFSTKYFSNVPLKNLKINEHYFKLILTELQF
ncbi:hypothetical protein PPRY_a3582 [Pseudoalteromonas prydzensis ACAM 620]|nr:hypothetical protein [Pseudoalteromonas prydzensis ACAM 620]